MSTRLKEIVSYNRHEEGLQVLCRLIRSKKVRVSFFQTVIQMLIDIMFTVYQILWFHFQSRMSELSKVVSLYFKSNDKIYQLLSWPNTGDKCHVGWTDLGAFIMKI